MPVSLLDLPTIRAAVSDFHRILEDPTPRNEAARRIYRWYTGNSKLGERNPDDAEAVQLVRAAVDWVMHHFGEHTRSECPEITDSQLDLGTKAALLELRDELLPPFASFDLTTNAALRVRFLLFLAEVLARITPPPTAMDDPRERLRQPAAEKTAGDAARREFAAWQDRRSAEVPDQLSPNPKNRSTEFEAREGETPPATSFIPLTTWNDIFAALNESHGTPQWRNNEQTRAKIRKLTEQHSGPIRFPRGKGKQPSVGKAPLLAWWGELRDHFDARTEEAKAEADSARFTAAASHRYGASGTVVPGIGGSEKRTRAKGSKNGREGKR